MNTKTEMNAKKVLTVKEAAKRPFHAAPHLARALEHVPKLLDGPVPDGQRDLARTQHTVRESAEVASHEQADL